MLCTEKLWPNKTTKNVLYVTKEASHVVSCILLTSSVMVCDVYCVCVSYIPVNIIIVSVKHSVGCL